MLTEFLATNEQHRVLLNNRVQTWTFKLFGQNSMKFLAYLAAALVLCSPAVICSDVFAKVARAIDLRAFVKASVGSQTHIAEKFATNLASPLRALHRAVHCSVAPTLKTCVKGVCGDGDPKADQAQQKDNKSVRVESFPLFVQPQDEPLAPTTPSSSAAADDSFWSSFDDDNESAMSSLLALSQSQDGWETVTDSAGVRVEKRFCSAGGFVRGEDAHKGSKHACVRSTGVIDAHPEEVFGLFADTTRVPEYNRLCASITDIKVLPRIDFEHNTTDAGIEALGCRLKSLWSKVSWAVTPSYPPFQSRDFLSVIHFRKYANGTSVVLNRPAYLDSHKPTENHVRAMILLGGNILRPHGASLNQTHITMIAQVNPGGGADTPTAAWWINKLSARGPLVFMRSLESAVRGASGAAMSTPLRETPIPELPPVAFESPLSTELASSFNIKEEAPEIVQQNVVTDERVIFRVPALKFLLKTSLKLDMLAKLLPVKLEILQAQVRQSEEFLRTKNALSSVAELVVAQGLRSVEKLQAQRPALDAVHKKCTAALATQLGAARLHSKVLLNGFMSQMSQEMNSRYVGSRGSCLSRSSASGHSIL